MQAVTTGGWVAAALLAISVYAADTIDWNISSRLVPPPAGASDALRGAIANTPQPDVAAGRSYPQNRAEWDALIAQRASARAVPLETVEKTFSVSIEADQIDAVAVYRIVPDKVSPAHLDHLFLYVHGGAYVFGGGIASVGEAAIIASSAGIPTLAIDYRMPPEHPFPAAIDDTVAVYKAILQDYAPSALAIGGTSAGGGLALAAAHKFKALGMPMLAAIYAGTPWADLTKTGDTLFTNEGLDRVLVTYDGSLGASARLYAHGHDMTDPLISPVYGDFRGFPPTILITGTRDMFLSDTARTHRKLRATGVPADLHVFEAMSHAGYAFELGSPESQQTYSELAKFLEMHLD